MIRGSKLTREKNKNIYICAAFFLSPLRTERERETETETERERERERGRERERDRDRETERERGGVVSDTELRGCLSGGNSKVIMEITHFYTMGGEKTPIFRVHALCAGAGVLPMHRLRRHI